MKRKSIKISLLVTLLLIISFVTLAKVNFLDYESPIGYDRINNISFKNFRGLEFFQKSLYGNKSFAYIKTSIEYEFEKDSILVQSFFHPSSSYVYNQNAFSNPLLKHEMYHFKITELYTRIAKKRISELNKANKNQIENIISAIKREEQSYQIEYDNDTFHSYVLSEQKKYERNIDSLLNLYNNFRNHKVVINEK